MLKRYLLALALAGLVSTSTSFAGPFADTVISYNPGIGFVANYTNIDTVLGDISHINPFFDATDPFDPPYGTNQILSVGAGGSLIVRFAAPVANSPGNRLGLDFTIFGNTGFYITNDYDPDTYEWIGTPATDGSLFAQNTGQTRVSVSQDGTNFFQLNTNLAPTVDNLCPTDATGDPQIPVDSTLVQTNFAGLTLEQIRAVYNGSAGGSSFDISWAQDTNGNPVSLSWIRYIRIDVVSGKSEIDAISSTAPLILTQPISQTVTNAGTDVTFSVVASGAATYQWQLNGVDIFGATNSSLTLSNAFVTENGGNYTAVIGSSGGGTVVSAVASLNKPMPAGIYSGLFYETNVVRHRSSGYFNFKLATARSFSGKIFIDGSSYGLAGKFGSNHQAQVVVLRANKPSSLNIALQLLTANSADQVVGTVTDGNWSAPLLGDRLVYSTNNLAPQSGSYSFTLFTESNGDTSPSNGSAGVATVKTNGAISLKGLLSDGISLSQSTYISKGGQWPLYVPLYKCTGSLLGWLTFTNQPTYKLTGNVSWIKTNAYGLYYTNGFTNSLTVFGGSRHP
jgi:hypothetical protein